MRNKGITLIALIVTIVIILVLVGISIAMISGENGILNKAKTAKNQYDTSSTYENTKLSEVGNFIDELTGVTSRGDTIGSRVKQNITISNLTGTTFKINVNSIDALNSKTLSYFVNDNLVYEGTESSFTVTGLTENTKYKVIVLADKNDIEVSTVTGDDVASWLATIGNTSGYTLDQVLNDDALLNNLMASDAAENYLFSSTEIILPAVFNSQKALIAMCNNASKSQPFIANSSKAISIMKSSSNYVQQTVTFNTRSDTMVNNQTVYNGKAFVFDATVTGVSTGIALGQYQGGSSFATYGAGSSGTFYSINKFVSILGGCRYYANNSVTAKISYLKL